MATQVASLFASLRLDDSQYRQGLRNAQQGLSGFGNSIAGFGTRVAGLGATITAATAPIAAMGAVGLRSFMNYEDLLKDIEIRAGLTASEMELLESRVSDIALSSVFTPTEISEAFLQLLTSGSSLEEAMMQIDGVWQGAAATGADLGMVADGLTDVMSSFGIEAEHSADVMQTLFDITLDSSQTFPELIAGFQNVGGVAASFGLSVEETAAILGVFREKGIQGAEAGTQLRSMLNNLTRDTEATQGAWDAIGVSMFNADGSMRNLNDVIDDMNVAMDGMSDEDRIRIIQDLAGSYGQLGLQALLAEGGYDAMLAKMAETTDIADAADDKMDTLSGAINFLKSSYELLMQQALEPLADQYLAPMVRQVADVVNQVTAWAKENPKLAGQIMQIVAGLVVLGPALMLVGGAIAAFGTAVAVVLSPAGLLIGAIVGILAAAQSMYPGGLVQLFDDAAASARMLAVMGLAFVNRAAEMARGALEALGIEIPTVVEFMDNIRTTATQLATIIMLGLNAAVASLAAQFRNLMAWLEPAKETMQWMIDNAGDAIESLGGQLGTIGELSEGVSGADRRSIWWNSILNQFRADGGPVSGGTPYVVGERGPELFIPDSGGSIVPNEAMNGVTINVYQQPGENGESLAARIERRMMARS